jgi:hypothetical protein
MSKKPVQNRSNIISNDLLSTFTKLNLDNIKEFFEGDTLFIAVSQEGTKDKIINTLANQFITRSKFVKNNTVVFRHVYENEIITNNVKIFTDEVESDYNDNMSDMKSLIKDYISKNMLYGRRM